MRRSTLGAATIAALALLPGSAYAGGPPSGDGVVYNYGEQVQFYASSGSAVANQVVVSLTGTALTIDDTNTIAPNDSNCVQAEGDTTKVVCEVESDFDYFQAYLSGGDDSLTNTLPDLNPQSEDDSSYVDLGAGNDAVLGSAGRDSVSAGPGNDTVEGRGGDDSISDGFSGWISFARGTRGGPPPGGTNVFDGGAGDDTVSGGPDGDTLRGGDGNDLLFDMEGGATLTGGGGDDTLRREALVDVDAPDGVSFDGGTGEDTVDYELYAYDEEDDQVTVPPTSPGATVVLDTAGPTTGNGFAGESDTLVGVEDADGSDGKDTLTGSSVGNELFGSGGDDTIFGGGGLDILEGSKGADRIDSRDGGIDLVRCAEQDPADAGDNAQVDNVDDVAKCPAAGAGTSVTTVPQPQPVVVQGPVQVVPGPGAPRDTTAPNIAATKIISSVRLSSFRKNGRVPCSLASTDATVNAATCTLTTAPAVKLAKAGDIVLAETKTTFTKSKKVNVTVAKKRRRLVRKKAKLTLTVTVRDASGNVATKRGTIRVK